MSTFSATFEPSADARLTQRRRAEPRTCSQIKSYKPRSERKPRSGFRYFLRLPLEIRLMIWDLSLPGPRILSLHINTTDKIVQYSRSCRPHIRALTSVSFTYSILSPSAVLEEKSDLETWKREHRRDAKLPRGPSALYVCRDSRQLAMKRYELGFAGTLIDESIATKHEGRGFGRRRLWLEHFGEKRIWIDFRRDIVLLDLSNEPFSTEHLRRFAPEETSKIRNLGLRGGWASHISGLTKSVAKAAEPFNGIERLVLWNWWQRIKHMPGSGWQDNEWVHSIGPAVRRFRKEVSRTKDEDPELPIITLMGVPDEDE